MKLGGFARFHKMLDMRCTHCDKRGRFPVPQLIAEHGPDLSLLDLAYKLSADCTSREASAHERCAVIFPQLFRRR